MSFPLKINPTLWGDLDAYLIGLHASLGPPESKSQTAADRFSRFGTAHCRVSLYFTMGRPLPLPLLPSFLIIYTPQFLPANYAMPVFSSQAFTIAAYYSFIDPEGMIALTWPGWLTYSGWFTHKVGTNHLQIERRIGKFAGERPALYHCATQPSAMQPNSLMETVGCYAYPLRSSYVCLNSTVVID